MLKNRHTLLQFMIVIQYNILLASNYLRFFSNFNFLTFFQLQLPTSSKRRKKQTNYHNCVSDLVFKCTCNGNIKVTKIWIRLQHVYMCICIYVREVGTFNT